MASASRLCPSLFRNCVTFCRIEVEQMGDKSPKNREKRKPKKQDKKKKAETGKK